MRRLLLSPLVVFAAACAVGGSTFAAYTATTASGGSSLEAGSVSLRDNDSGSALLGLANAGAGATTASCIRVTSDGSLTTQVRLTGQGAGPLAPYLRTRVVRGTGAAGFGDCTGFTADPRDYYGLGAGVLFDGRLSDLPSTWATGVSDPSATRLASSGAGASAARTGIAGLWELGDRTRRIDDFDDTPGSSLSTHRELRGSLWTLNPGSTADAVLTAAGRVRPDGPGVAVYRVNTVNAAEILSADFTLVSASGEAGIIGNAGTADDAGIVVRYVAASGAWQLGTMNAGMFTILDSWAGGPMVVGQTVHVALHLSTGSQTVLLDGTPRLSATDATVAATGRAAIRLLGAGTQDDSTGVHIDDFRSVQPLPSLATPSIGGAATLRGTPVRDQVHPSATDPLWSALFDGASSWMELPAAGVGASAVTAAGWFRLTSGDVLLRDSSTGTAGWSLGYDDGSGTMHVRVSGETFDTGVAMARVRGAWHHHALVRNGSSVTYYLDGRRVLDATASATTAPVSPWMLMKDGTGASLSAGRADTVGLWARALADDEVARLRDDVAPPADWEQGDSHWYRVEVTVGDDPAAQSSSGSATFGWEARSR